MAKLSERLEEAKAEARERPLTTEQVEKLLQEPTTPESGVSITAIEELRAQLLAQLGELDPRNPAYTALLAKISSGSAKELSSLDGEIALAIAESTTEKAFASAEAEAEAARHAQKELLHAWHNTEKAEHDLITLMDQMPLSDAQRKEWEEAKALRTQAEREAEEEAKRRGIADWRTDPELSRRVNATVRGMANVAGKIADNHPEHPELKTRVDALAASARDIETAQQRAAETEHRKQEDRHRAAETQHRANETEQRIAERPNDMDDLFGPSSAPASASTAQPAAAAPVNLAATAAAAGTAAAPAQTTLGNAIPVSVAETGQMASPLRVVTVPAPTVTVGTRTT